MTPRLSLRACARFCAALLAGGIFLAACSGDDPAVPARAEDATCEPLKALESYRYTFRYVWESPKPEPPVDESQVGDPPFAISPNTDTLKLEQVFSGSFLQPDRYKVTVDTLITDTDSQPIDLLFFGGASYVDLGGGRWSVTETPNSYPPLTICEALLPGVDLSGVSGSLEEIDGEAVTHFRRDDAQADAVSTLFGGNSDMGRTVKSLATDVWLTEEGWPMRLEAKGAGPYPSGREMRVEFSLELTDINSNDIKIEIPQPAAP